jgi:hypothetical protein
MMVYLLQHSYEVETEAGITDLCSIATDLSQSLDNGLSILQAPMTVFNRYIIPFLKNQYYNVNF